MQGDGSDSVHSQLADLTRRLGSIESAAGRISGGQSTIATVARLKDQVTYLGRWVHALCEQVWDIQRYTRRRSLHVVSFYFLCVVYLPLYLTLFSFPCFRVVNPLCVKDLLRPKLWIPSDLLLPLTSVTSCRIVTSLDGISLLCRWVYSHFCSFLFLFCGFLVFVLCFWLLTCVSFSSSTGGREDHTRDCDSGHLTEESAPASLQCCLGKISLSSRAVS